MGAIVRPNARSLPLMTILTTSDAPPAVLSTFDTVASLRFAPERAAILGAKIDPSRPLHVLVSFEFDGLYKNGGIGTYYRQLARELHAAGEQVVGIAANGERTWRFGDSPLPEFEFMLAGVDVYEVLSSPLAETAAGAWSNDGWSLKTSFSTFGIVAALRNLVGFDCPMVVELHELCGMSYLTVQAARSGALGEHFVAIVGTHSPEHWIRLSNGHFGRAAHEPRFGLLKDAERISFEQADISFSPSEFLLRQERHLGWKVDDAVVLRYPLPLATPSDDPPRPETMGRPVVFFGRLEERKGLKEFCDAVSMLDPSLRGDIDILFVGKITDTSAGVKSDVFIKRALGDTCRWRIFDSLDREQALGLVHGLDDPVVFLGSPQDNFPNTALEMSQLPCAVVACDGTGLEEALRYCGTWSDELSFAPHDSDGATRALTRALKREVEIPPMLEQAHLERLNSDVMSQRAELIAQRQQQISDRLNFEHPECLGVLVSNADGRLIDTLESIAGQNFDGLVDVLVVENRMAEPQDRSVMLMARRNFAGIARFVEVEEALSLGRQRNLLQSISHATHVVHLQSGDVLDREALNRLSVAAARSGADIVASHRTTLPSFSGHPAAEPAEIAPARPGFINSSFSENRMSAGVSLIAAHVFDSFAWIEDVDACSSTLDWCLYVTAVLSNLSTVSSPEIVALEPDRPRTEQARQQFLLREAIATQFNASDPMRQFVWALLNQSAAL